jgi:hypothetical protein
MKRLDLNSTIGDWISERPHASQVFASLRLDCREGRGKSLQQECWERKLAPLDVLAQLQTDVEPVKQEDRTIYDRSIGSMNAMSGG